MTDAENLPGGGGNVVGTIIELGIQIGLALARNPTWEGFLRFWFETPFGNFLDLFGEHGRPKVGPDSATEEVATFLRRSVNPLPVWYGVAVRGLEAQGIPISVSHGVGRQKYDRLARSFRTDFARQWRGALGEDYAARWFRAIQNLKSSIGNSIRADQGHKYRDAVSRVLIDPTTGFPPVNRCDIDPVRAAECAHYCVIGGPDHDPQKCAQCCGGNKMACASTHVKGQVVQGPGACCSALGKSGLTPHIGLRIGTTITTKTGPKCIVCEIASSKSAKHPGAPVFKRGKFGPVDFGQVCVSSRGGCCQLQTVAAGV